MEGYISGWASAADDVAGWKDTQDFLDGRLAAAERVGADATTLESWRRIKRSSFDAAFAYFGWTTGRRVASAAGKRGYADAFNAGRAAGQSGSERPRALRN